MSRKENCLDNAPMENFFGILKQEMFYEENYSSYEKKLQALLMEKDLKTKKKQKR